MARFDLSLLGDKVLQETLRTLPEKMERRVVQRALNRTAKFLRTLVQGRAPARSGRLRASLRARNMRRRKHRVGTVLLTGTRTQLGIPAGARGFYPFAQEAGWRPGQRAARVPGQRYFREPLRSPGLLAVLRREIDDGIERELLKAGGVSDGGN